IVANHHGSLQTNCGDLMDAIADSPDYAAGKMNDYAYLMRSNWCQHWQHVARYRHHGKKGNHDDSTFTSAARSVCQLQQNVTVNNQCKRENQNWSRKYV